MTRKFKLFGVLMAVVAMFAISASSSSATFTSANYPATGSGSTTGDTIDAFGSSIACANNTFTIDSIAGPTNTLTVTPSYNKCTAFGAFPMTVNLTGCDVVAHSGEGFGTILTDLVCPAGVTGVLSTVFSDAKHSSALCHLVLHPFTNKAGLTATNNGAHVLIKGTLENLTMTQSRTSAFCPAGTHTGTAKYTTQAAGATVAGSNGAISLD